VGNLGFCAFANGDIIQLTHQNYSEMIKTNLLLVIDINASWCSACKMMNPIMDELSQEYQGQVQFAKIDYDSEPELVKKYDAPGLPTIVFIKPGQKKPAVKVVGAVSKEDLEQKISQLLN
jgi:thioredoxin 1